MIVQSIIIGSDQLPQQLFPPQQDVINAGLLEGNEHLLLNMATGSGKTFLAELAIRQTVQQGYKAVYITPLKALATQQKRTWAKKYSGLKIGVFTGDTPQKDKSHDNYCSSQLLILTPERLDMCLRTWRHHWDWLPEVNLVVIDEFHLLGQGLRGARLEGCLTRLIRLNPFVRLIALSATMPNAAELAAWLHGQYYQSKWRQIPLKKEFVRFKNAKDKPQLLLEAVERCLSDGGQSLVFCNSRKRAQELASYLSKHGIASAFHHAGLLPEQREKIETDFQSKAVRVLVATSTLEMGLNLPSRQVVLYDTYAYTGYGFDDLPVWSYIQRTGRAGRPGLDTTGEAVMLLPRWVSKSPYENDACEPIQSQIGERTFMQEQILIEVFSGYSKTLRELTEGFLPLTFYKAQYPEATLAHTVNSLLLGNLLYESESTGDVMDRPLKVSLLGRLAIKLMFSVETVRTVKAIYESGQRLYLFDLLLMATLCPDCEPVLNANFEETKTLCSIVQPLPSNLLDYTEEKLRKSFPENLSKQRLLAVIKMAAVCYCLTTEQPVEEIAERFMTYPADVYFLRDSVIRVLQGIQAIMEALDKKDLGEDETIIKKRQKYGSAIILVRMLTDMLQYRLSAEIVSLTMLRGVGGQRAAALAGVGYETVASIAEASPKALAKIDGIGKKLSTQLIEDAKKLCAGGEITIYREEPVGSIRSVRDVQTGIDPYRLVRSVELTLAGSEGNRYRVCGGREDHIITRCGDNYHCDCMDFQQRGLICKHILCVRRETGDAEILKALEKMKTQSNRSIRENLPNLWYATAKEARR